LTDSILYDLPIPGPADRIAKIASTRGSNQFDVIVATAPPSASSASPSSTPARAAEDGPPPRVPQLAILPTKFRKLVWVKRNDYVIVDTGSSSADETTTTTTRAGDDGDDGEEPRGAADEGSPARGESVVADSGGSGVRLMITHILYKEQVKHLKAEGLWPSHDPEFVRDAPKGDGDSDDDDAHDDSSVDGDDDSNADPDPGRQGTLHENDDGIVYGDDDDGDMFLNTNRVAALRVDDSSSSDDESR
jgi:probable RNA-binding protein EIF1AD